MAHHNLMEDDPLECADKAFALAGDFGRWMDNVFPTLNILCQPSNEKYRETLLELKRRFPELVEAVVVCGSLIQSSPPEWNHVAAIARQLAQWAASWETKIKNDLSSDSLWELFEDRPTLNALSRDGHEAIQAAKKSADAQRWDFLRNPSNQLARNEATTPQGDQRPPVMNPTSGSVAINNVSADSPTTETSRPFVDDPVFRQEENGEIGFAPWVEQIHGVLLDQINLGPTPAAGNKFQISSFDAKIVQGDAPSVCPKTDRPVPEAWLPTIEAVFKRCGYVKSGETIHWVGSQSKLANVCTCYLASTEQFDVSTESKLGVNKDNDFVDPIAESLSSQPLKLYLFLRDRNHWTQYATLREQVHLWRAQSPADETIHRALRRLRDELNSIDASPHLSIEHDSRRARLDRTRPK